MRKARTIDKRFIPPVKGIDLQQAFNYIDARDATPTFFYDRYTSSRITYVPGSRPVLEKIVRDLRVAGKRPLEKVRRIADYLAHKVIWAGYYEKKTGKTLQTDRNMTEEEIAGSGYGWCNEQSRLFCALTQIAGVQSR